jgi:hypothetical protein
MLSDTQFLFIIGSPRSGTTWLQTMIGAHPLVCTTVELRLYSQYTAPWIKAWKEEAANIVQGRWHQGLPFLWSEDEFYRFLRGFLKKVYEKVIATNPEATHILDKHPGYSLYVEDIQRLLPRARFIHVIRDGRDVAVSMVAARKQVGFGTATIQDSAAAWKEHVRAAQKARQYQDRYMEVRYEDLFTAGADILKSVFDFCGLPATVERVTGIVNAHQFKQMKAERRSADKRVRVNQAHYRKGRVGSWREELGPFQRYIFNEIAGDLLRELGYAEDGWWADSRKQKLTLPVLAAISTISNRFRHAATALLGHTLIRYTKAVHSKIKFKTARLVLKKLER